ncbi:hypothetical protein HP436_13085 [Pseudomonas sp. CrR14]|nr:hypothetical protein [Pseudomonas sp. CrR14]
MKLQPILDAMKHACLRNKTERHANPFSKYYDEISGVFCIGNIPLRIKQEACSMIEGKLDNKVQFNQEFVDNLGLSQEGREIFDRGLQGLCLYISKLIGNEPREKKQPLYPWQCAVLFVPSLKFNAWVRLSHDEKDNTALIFINIGVLLENLNRLHASYSTPGFLDLLRHGTLAQDVSFGGDSGCLNNLSTNPIFRATATEISVKASMLVVLHEYAHFLCGHVSYLRSELSHSGEIYEAPETEPAEPLDNTIRRVIEMDADQKAGGFGSSFWRLLDHPAVSPKDCQNESFSMEFISAVLSNNLILGQYDFSDRYYSPLWRAQHIIEVFYNDFFHVDKYLPEIEQQNARNEISNEMYNVQLKLVAEHERVYRIMDWGDGLSFEKVERDIDTLLGEDEAVLKALQPVFQKYMPTNFFYQRPKGQNKY